MFKKLVLAPFVLVSIMLAETSFDTKSNFDSVTLTGFETEISDAKKKEFGVWYLKHAKKAEWERVHNDEFEFENSIINSYKEFVEAIKKNSNFKDQVFEVLVDGEFLDYDFEKNIFPIDGLNHNSYLDFKGNAFSEVIKLSFENTDIEKDFFAMPKDKASVFIKNRKSSSGYINRKVTLKYKFKISMT